MRAEECGLESSATNGFFVTLGLVASSRRHCSPRKPRTSLLQQSSRHGCSDHWALRNCDIATSGTRLPAEGVPMPLQWEEKGGGMRGERRHDSEGHATEQRRSLEALYMRILYENLDHSDRLVFAASTWPIWRANIARVCI